VLAHLLLLQLLLHFINKAPVPKSNPTEILPITIIPKKEPVITKVTAKPSTKTTPHKKVAPLPQVQKSITVEPLHASPELATSSLPSSENPTPVADVGPALLLLPPPSASYLLDVIRTEPKLANPYYGAGKIQWHHDSKNYTMQIEVGIDILFTTIRLYSMQSEGTIGDTGIQPHKTTESRRTKADTTTQFNYDNKSISFSADPVIIPLLEGAQDKITVLMQLASLGNADPAQFQPGKEIAIQVAEEKEAHLHQFVVLDQETIDTKLGHLVTWHLVRPPRPGFYSSRIDIWLAPKLNWLPVQIRNTEANGAITTQTIRQIIHETPN
jgi:hypothetical protein